MKHIKIAAGLAHVTMDALPTWSKRSVTQAQTTSIQMLLTCTTFRT